MPDSAVTRLSVLLLFAALLSVGNVRQARAEGFISPFIGYNFGGDSGCPQITNCEDKHANFGVSFGALGKIVGFEEEIATTTDFFGQTPNQSSHVLTLMSNFMLAPRIGPVQPYGLGGVGLIRTTVEGGTSSDDQNQIGWDVGGGVMVFFGQHVGMRGEIRYYHAFQALEFLNLPPGLPPLGLGGSKLDYGRAALGVVFKF